MTSTLVSSIISCGENAASSAKQVTRRLSRRLSSSLFPGDPDPRTPTKQVMQDDASPAQRAAHANGRAAAQAGGVRTGVLLIRTLMALAMVGAYMAAGGAYFTHLEYDTH
jgi:hypothetical protein